jgi:hypothetical protein
MELRLSGSGRACDIVYDIERQLSGPKGGADGCDVVGYLIAAQKVVELLDKGLL